MMKSPGYQSVRFLISASVVVRVHFMQCQPKVTVTSLCSTSFIGVSAHSSQWLM
uniref:Uncharacterized protein n=1 Tax=Arion vulgaris TaxID=1028688 RepID=A0A0B7B0D7_9EUPU